MFHHFQTFERNGLSPGHFNVKYSSKLDSYRMKKKAKARLPETKRRRLILKQERATDKVACEATEGSTYQSGKLTLHINLAFTTAWHSS
jgi:hypothetical protein